MPVSFRFPTVAVLVCTAHAAPTMGQFFAYNDFDDTTGLVLFDKAHVELTAQDGSVIRLAPAAPNGNTGLMVYESPLTGATFHDALIFRLTEPGGATDDTGSGGGDGVFFSIGPTLEYMGASTLPDHVLTVHLNTFRNDDDISSNCARISVGHGPFNDQQSVAPDFDDGQLWYVWLDFDGETVTLRLSQSTIRPAQPVLSVSADIDGFLGHNGGYFALGAYTGDAWENHDVVAWSHATQDCYADCEMFSGAGVFDLFDFLCFQNRFFAGDPYADCDSDGKLGLFDYLCFVNEFNQGCL